MAFSTWNNIRINPHISVPFHQATFGKIQVLNHPWINHPQHHTQAVHEVPHSSTLAVQEESPLQNGKKTDPTSSWAAGYIFKCLKKEQLSWSFVSFRFKGWKQKLLANCVRLASLEVFRGFLAKLYLFWSMFDTLRRCYFWKEAVILAPNWTVLLFLFSVFLTFTSGSFGSGLEFVHLISTFENIFAQLHVPKASLANPYHRSLQPLTWWWFQISNPRLFQRTELEHTPSNLYQQAIYIGIPLIIGVAGGLPFPGVRYRGVWLFSWNQISLSNFHADP